MSENPYRILGIAPWYTMTEIKDEYHRLMKIIHPDKVQGVKEKEEARRKFDKIQRAYLEIKEARNEEKGDSQVSGLYLAIKKCFYSIIIVIIGIYIAFYFFVFMNYIYTLFLKYMLLFWVFFFTIETFFAHYFPEEEFQYLITLILTIAVGKFHSYLLNKKVKGDDLKKIN